jgi:hypothetical protein
LDLKPLYDKDTDSLKWDELWISVLKQIKEEEFKKIF